MYDEDDTLEPQSGTEGEAGDLGPEAGPADSAEADDDRERLEHENYELRKQLRHQAAETLVARHNLLPSHVEVLSNVPRDQQQAAAQRFASELEQYTTGYDPDLAPSRVPATGAPSAGHIAGDAPNPTPAGPTVRTGGPQPTDQDPGFATPEAAQAIREARSFDELSEVQADEARRRPPAPWTADEATRSAIREARDWSDLARIQQDQVEARQRSR